MERKKIYTVFPEGKYKALTLSYDDGREEDRKLISIFRKYGLKATFNLNSGLADTDLRRIRKNEWPELYAGFEIAAHTVTHPTISRCPLSFVAEEILKDFASIPMRRDKKVQVGIVGEIYIKFSPLGNNNLEDFLLGENCEVVIPGFLDFCLYCINDSIVENKMYGGKLSTRLIYKLVFEYFCKKQKDMIKMIQKHGVFRAPSPFKHTKTLADGYVSEAMNMGEGWLLTAEMLELIEQGVNNVVCTQPFGCLPNHIVGRGMMKIIKEKNPQSNIVSIDYDPSATRVNQENRIKLMLSNAKKELEAELA